VGSEKDMKRKLIWRKKIVIGTICLMLLLVTIPTITANNKLGDDFNLKAQIHPFRKVFPHIYSPLIKAQFDCSYSRTNGTYTGGNNFTFQVIRLADNKVVYSEVREMEPLTDGQTGSGMLIDYTCYSGIQRFVSLYEAKIILNVNDNNPLDNEASCYFIVIESI
jgi:hypothetical protein